MWHLDMYTQAETLALGERLGRVVPPGVCLCLRGDLGAGKTLFTQGLALGLDIPERATSPTFTIVNQYPGGRVLLNHLDMYRINNEDELWELGIEEYFECQAVTVVEWPDILGTMLPDDAVNITIEKCYDNDKEWRRITIDGSGAGSAWLEEALADYANIIN